MIIASVPIELYCFVMKDVGWQEFEGGEVWLEMLVYVWYCTLGFGRMSKAELERILLICSYFMTSTRTSIIFLTHSTRFLLFTFYFLPK